MFYENRKSCFKGKRPASPMVRVDQGEIFLKGKYPKDKCRWTTMIARRYSLHNNERELIDCFASSLGSANPSVRPELSRGAEEHLRAIF